jgi:hypothetical protein
LTPISLNPGQTSFTSSHTYSTSGDYTIQTTVSNSSYSYGGSVENDADATVYAMPQIAVVSGPANNDGQTTTYETSGQAVDFLVGFGDGETYDRPVTVYCDINNSSGSLGDAAINKDYTITGATDMGQDPTFSGGQLFAVTIPAGQTEATVAVTPLASANRAGGSLTVTMDLLLTNGSGYWWANGQHGTAPSGPSSFYSEYAGNGTFPAATVTIVEDAPPELELQTHDLGGADSYFTIAYINGFIDHTVVVHYTADSGNGSKYQFLSGDVVFNVLESLGNENGNGIWPALPTVPIVPLPQGPSSGVSTAVSGRSKPARWAK